jgi:hypothetical protein
LSTQTKWIGVTLCLMAMAFFAGWPFWKWLNAKAVNASLRERTQTLVEKNPQLETAWTIAMQDDVLTWPEAKVIVEAGGETIDPEE